jgi:hypothetical protein
MRLQDLEEGVYSLIDILYRNLPEETEEKPVKTSVRITVTVAEIRTDDFPDRSFHMHQPARLTYCY